MSEPGIVGQVVADYLKRFPNTSSKTIAGILVKEQAPLFKSIDNAYALLRYYRGALGDRSRRQLVNRQFMRPPQPRRDPFPPLPEPKTHFDHWNAVEFPDKGLWLVISDLHIPYHHNDSIASALTYGKNRGATGVLLNGDVADCFSISNMVNRLFV